MSVKRRRASTALRTLYIKRCPLLDLWQISHGLIGSPPERKHYKGYGDYIKARQKYNNTFDVLVNRRVKEIEQRVIRSDYKRFKKATSKLFHKLQPVSPALMYHLTPSSMAAVERINSAVN